MLNSTLNPHTASLSSSEKEKETQAELPILTKTNANTLHKHLRDHFFAIRFHCVVNPSPCDSQRLQRRRRRTGSSLVFLPRNIPHQDSINPHTSNQHYERRRPDSRNGTAPKKNGISTEFWPSGEPLNRVRTGRLSFRD